MLLDLNCSCLFKCQSLKQGIGSMVLLASSQTTCFNSSFCHAEAK